MTVTVAVDPGKVRSGLAVLVDGQLAAARLVPGAGRDQPAASPLRELCAGHSGVLVVEVPQVYDPSKSPARARDLVDLAVVAGAWTGYGAGLGLTVREVNPARWKGQLPKHVTAERARAVLTTEERDLLDAELSRVRRSLRHNVLDAVALVLVEAGRLKLRGR